MEEEAPAGPDEDGEDDGRCCCCCSKSREMFSPFAEDEEAPGEDGNRFSLHPLTSLGRTEGGAEAGCRPENDAEGEPSGRGAVGRDGGGVGEGDEDSCLRLCCSCCCCEAAAAADSIAAASRLC